MYGHVGLRHLLLPLPPVMKLALAAGSGTTAGVGGNVAGRLPQGAKLVSAVHDELGAECRETAADGENPSWPGP